MNLKARTHRFMLVNVVLLAGLAATRYLTRDTNPNLVRLEQQRDLLMDQQAELRREVDALEGVVRVRAWATSNGMVPWSIVPHETSTLPGLQEPGTATPPQRIEVRSQWR